MPQKMSKPERRGIALKRLESEHRVNTTDCASILNLHPYTVRDYITAGYLEAFQIGSRMYVTEDEIDRYNKEGKRLLED